jgi:hypothetical protein
VKVYVFFIWLMGAQRLEHPVSDTRSRSGILVAVAAAAGAFGAAAMMAAATPPTARADDTTLIIDAIEGDYASGQADFTAAFNDFGSGAFLPGLAESFDGVDQDSLAATDNLLLGTVEALEGDPITSSLFLGELSAPDSFADASAEAQIFFNEGEGLLSNAAIALSAGDYGAAADLGLAGSADVSVLPLEELLLGAAASANRGRGAALAGARRLQSSFVTRRNPRPCRSIVQHLYFRRRISYDLI